MFNKSILMGRLVRDPDSKTTENQVAVCSFTLAANRRFKNKSGEYEADFISCVAWRQTAEFISKYFRKGNKLMVCGTLQSRTYENKDGAKVYVTELVAEEAYFVDSKSDQESAGSGGSASVGSGYGSYLADDPAGKSLPAADISADDDTSLPFDL